MTIFLFYYIYYKKILLIFFLFDSSINNSIYSIYQLFLFILLSKMGCQPSHEEKSLGIIVSILDSSFMKTHNDNIRQRMNALDIKYQVYLSLSCFFDEISKEYTNQIIVVEENLPALLNQLKHLNFSPNIYVLTTKQKIEQEQQNKGECCISYYKSYSQIIQKLSTRTFQKRKLSINPSFVPQKAQTIGVKILRSSDQKSLQVQIFEQTLNSKKIAFQVYSNFTSLENSMSMVVSKFIVTDYVYHREVINLVETNGLNAHVVCYCTNFKQEENFDPRLYFITDNFMEIIAEISSEQKMAHLNHVKCSKAFVYANQQSYLLQYVPMIEHFDFQIKIFDSISKIIKQSKYFFALTIIIDPEQRKDVERLLMKDHFLYKTKIIQIKKGTDSSITGLRKIIKELRKGYKAEKGLTKSVDIIDKHFDSVKFDGIKKQLQKTDINFFGYKNLSSFIKTKGFVSPFIICNFEERTLLSRYLNQIQSKAKIILFCNKSHISNQLKQNKNYAFLSSHFGKILKFIKKNTVYNPYIVDEHDNKIKEKKQKLNNRNKRISALKWYGIQQNEKTSQQMIELQKQFELLNIMSDTNHQQIREIQRDSAAFFKLDYLPVQKPAEFKSDLIESLKRLKSILKISYPQGEFQKILSQVSSMQISSLLKKVQSFFSSQNQLGLKINKALVDISVLSKEQITSMRQFLYLVNLNYLSAYKTQTIGKVRLYHYLNSKLIQKCQVGSYLLNKNYYVFYQQDHQDSTEDKLGKYKIELEFQNNTFYENHLQINPYFQFNDKYIFSPFSQFMIKQIRHLKDLCVITVEYKRNVEFLNCFFADNLLKPKQNIIQLCEEQLHNFKQQKSSSLVDKSNVDDVQLNLMKTNAMKNFTGGNLQKAIQLQKKVICQQQSLQNFNPTKLQTLHYQLCCFYLKSSLHSQCKQLIKQLLDSQPNQYLKDKLRILQNYYNKQQTQQHSQDSKEILKVMTMKRITLDQEEDQLSQESDVDNIFQMVEIDNQMPCIQVDRFDQYEQQQKQNILV